MKKYLSELWEKYPVTFKKEPTKDGSVTYISFDKNGEKSVADWTLSEEENKNLSVINKVIAESTQNGGIMPQWAGYQHGDFIYEACVKSQFPNAAVAQSAADDPDFFLPRECPLKSHRQCRLQSMQSSIHGIIITILTWDGEEHLPIPSHSQIMQAAYMIWGRPPWRHKILAGAVIFLRMLEIQCIPEKKLYRSSDYIFGTDIHGKYESYVSSKWGSDTSGLKKVIHDNNNWYMVIPWDSGTQQLATYSNSDLDTLYNEVYVLQRQFGQRPKCLLYYLQQHPSDGQICKWAYSVGERLSESFQNF